MITVKNNPPHGQAKHIWIYMDNKIISTYPYSGSLPTTTQLQIREKYNVVLNQKLLIAYTENCDHLADVKCIYLLSN